MNEFIRTASLIGESGLEKIRKATVAVFGIGGVGSYAAESLVRSGVGTLYLYDNDTVSVSNINRQLIALHSTLGEYKTEAAKRRFDDINPDCNIIISNEFITTESVIPFGKFDFIIDAVDNVTAKLFLICEAKKTGTPAISVMGTGNKLDPTRLHISDISETRICPLARVMRKELKNRGVLRQEVVWTDEPPVRPQDLGETGKQGRIPPASMPFVPGAAGLIAASAAIKKITE